MVASTAGMALERACGRNPSIRTGQLTIGVNIELPLVQRNPKYCVGLATLVIKLQNSTMNIHLSLTPIISLIAGILILIMPKLLNFVVAAYLIAIGVIGLMGVR